MWKRRTIKKKAVTLLKKSYSRMLSVCFLIAMLTAAYSVSTTFFNLQMPSEPSGTDAAYTFSISNSEAVLDTISHFFEGTPLAAISDGILYDISSVVIDLFSTNISVFFTFLRTIYYYLAEDTGTVLLFSTVSILFAFLYQIFISNILLIGEKRFFLENRNYRQTPVSKIFFLFKLRYIRHPAWVMFMRSLFQSLWNLTVVGGDRQALRIHTDPIYTGRKSEDKPQRRFSSVKTAHAAQ